MEEQIPPFNEDQKAQGFYCEIMLDDMGLSSLHIFKSDDSYLIQKNSTIICQLIQHKGWTQTEGQLKPEIVALLINAIKQHYQLG